MGNILHGDHSDTEDRKLIAALSIVVYNTYLHFFVLQFK